MFTSFISSIAPLFITVMLNLDHYTKTKSSTISLTFGGMLALAFVFLKAINKLPKPKNNTVLFGILFLMVSLLEPFILDLKILLFMAFLGSLIDTVLFSPIISKLREEMIIEKQTNSTSVALRQIIQEERIGRV